MKRGNVLTVSENLNSDKFEPKVKKPRPISDDNGSGLSVSSSEELWNIEEELQYEFDISLDISRNVCKLLDEGNSIPFIAR